MNDDRPIYLNAREAAEHLRLSPQTLANRRASGRLPRWRKAGSRVLYALSDLEAFVRPVSA